MKRFLLISLLLSSSLFALNSTQVRAFIQKSVTPETYAPLGFLSMDEVQRAKIGAKLQLRDVESELLQSYPATDFSVESEISYYLVTVEEVPRCIAVID